MNLQVNWADRVAITGPNGAGKSTLIGALLGRVPLSSGSASLGSGISVGEVDQADEAPPAPSVWERMALTVPVHRSLTHALIAEAALRIADVQGIAAVSMRRLAIELGVSSMTCYRTAKLEWLLKAGDYPLYERSIREGGPRDDEQAGFEFGLDCLLDGIAARLTDA